MTVMTTDEAAATITQLASAGKTRKQVERKLDRRMQIHEIMLYRSAYAAPKTPSPPGTMSRADQMVAAQRKRTRAIRDVGPIPGIEDPARRGLASQSLEAFCLTYMPETFSLPFGEDHHTLIEGLEQTIMQGGQLAYLLARGSGKTSLTLAAALWAVCNGYRRYVALVASDATRAKQLLANIVVQLESNDLLLADYPEICYPIRRLEGINQRCSGQLVDGQPTDMQIGQSIVRLPTIEGSKAAGAVIQAGGLTGGLRGMQVATRSGETLRPDLMLVDDPQTEASARSQSQCQRRERIIQAAILNLGGPGVKVAAFLAITQIAPDDLAERTLDRKRNPYWRGLRMPMLKSLPKNLKLWDEYGQILVSCLSDGDRGPANDFYLEHRTEMDEGAETGWEERYEPDQVSAIQHAMELRLRDPESFASEYQGRPLKAEYHSRSLSRASIAAKITGSSREIPAWATCLTAGMDLHDGLIYWTICAWSQQMKGRVLRWGCWPEQASPIWTMSTANPTMETLYPDLSREARIGLGCRKVAEIILDSEWRTEDGVPMQVLPLLADANWGVTTELVYRLGGERSDGRLLPCHGRYVGASRTPISSYRPESGEVAGDQWRIRPPKRVGHGRYCIFDSNYWKSMMAEQLIAAPDDEASLDIAGDAGDAEILIEHLLAETRIAVETKDRRTEEWRLKSNKPDNHLLDTLVMCCVGASMAGCSIRRGEVKPKKENKPKNRATKLIT